MSKIRLAIAGVGNCANSLIQGLEYYKDADPSDEVPGLMHVVLGGYHIRDVELVAAFDVDAREGRPRRRQGDLGQQEQHGEVRRGRRTSASPCRRGPTLDGFGEFYTQEICEESPADAGRRRAGPARHPQADVLVSYPPGRLRRGATELRTGLPRLEARSSTPSRCLSPATPNGRRSLPKPACPSSATTSKAR